jgi:hypothetical protein
MVVVVDDSSILEKDANDVTLVLTHTRAKAAPRRHSAAPAFLSCDAAGAAAAEDGGGIPIALL